MIVGRASCKAEVGANAAEQRSEQDGMTACGVEEMRVDGEGGADDARGRREGMSGGSTGSTDGGQRANARKSQRAKYTDMLKMNVNNRCEVLHYAHEERHDIVVAGLAHVEVDVINA